MKIPRILLAAGASGSGKTLITCGLLQALVNRNLKTASFKCGPDYIDPMFHSRVIGAKSRNLDTFFTGEAVTRYLLGSNAADCDIAVMEGVMGYYDGLGGTTSRASAYDLAVTTDTPVILIVNSRGMSVSLAAYVKGFLDYKENSHIAGVIFNQMSPMLYPRMKELVERELGIQVFGYVPKAEDCVIESRHLGLVLPEEIPELKERLMKLAGILEKTLEVDAIIRLANAAPELNVSSCSANVVSDSDVEMQKGNVTTEYGENSAETMAWKNVGRQYLRKLDTVYSFRLPKPVRVAVAKDEAFCFFYEDNFRLLQEMGAELVPFSPIHDKEFPENVDGLLLYGGYPELNGKALEDNFFMRQTVKQKISEGLPCMAECGGFMYLHEEMEDMDGTVRQMAGVIPGKVYRTDRLNRFGYTILKQKQAVFGEAALGEIPAHEFHYFDSENCGTAFEAQKPLSNRSWDCIHGNNRMLTGFPHLHYYGNPRVARAFLNQCLEYKKEREKE